MNRDSIKNNDIFRTKIIQIEKSEKAKLTATLGHLESNTNIIPNTQDIHHKKNFSSERKVGPTPLECRTGDGGENG